jgi:hypothetical protein
MRLPPAVTYVSVRVPWKLIGAAGLAGVAATGVVVARRRRAQRNYDPDELRERLHAPGGHRGFCRFST